MTYYHRDELRRSNIPSAKELRARRNGELVRVARCIIARKRPDTARGLIFISMEDETGVASVIVVSIFTVGIGLRSRAVGFWLMKSDWLPSEESGRIWKNLLANGKSFRLISLSKP
ncbi:MAG: hypothetical protein ACRD27_03375 [Terracidiphilus sp.]